MALVSKLEDENRRLRDELQNKNQLDDRSELLNSPESISMKIISTSENESMKFFFLH